MEENYVTVVVSKSALHTYQKAVDALRDAESSFELASENFHDCKDSDGSIVKDAVDLVVAARKAKSDAAFEIAEDIKANELGVHKPLSRAEKARRGAEYLKKRLDDIKSFGTDRSDCELQA